MADVRLTAINPDDSSVVPVACNSKGELLLEDPIVVEGPQGPPGPDGAQGPPGQDGAPGQDGDSFVPDPSTGSDGQVLTTDGTACFWSDLPASGLLAWRYYLRAGYSTKGVAVDGCANVFDGNENTYTAFEPANGNTSSSELVLPVHMLITDLQVRLGYPTSPMVVTLNGKSEQLTPINDAWTKFPRFNSEDCPAGSVISFASQGGFFKLNGIKLNNTELIDGSMFNQLQLFSLEHLVKTAPEMLKALVRGVDR